MVQFRFSSTLLVLVALFLLLSNRYTVSCVTFDIVLGIAAVLASLAVQTRLLGMRSGLKQIIILTFSDPLTLGTLITNFALSFIVAGAAAEFSPENSLVDELDWTVSLAARLVLTTWAVLLELNNDERGRLPGASKGRSVRAAVAWTIGLVATYVYCIYHMSLDFPHLFASLGAVVDSNEHASFRANLLASVGQAYSSVCSVIVLGSSSIIVEFLKHPLLHLVSLLEAHFGMVPPSPHGTGGLRSDGGISSTTSGKLLTLFWLSIVDLGFALDTPLRTAFRSNSSSVPMIIQLMALNRLYHCTIRWTSFTYFRSILAGYEEHRDIEEHCVICQDQIHVGQSARLLPCRHAFHSSCIQNWLLVSQQCPTCRRPLRGVHQGAHPAETPEVNIAVQVDPSAAGQDERDENMDRLVDISNRARAQSYHFDDLVMIDRFLTHPMTVTPASLTGLQQIGVLALVEARSRFQAGQPTRRSTQPASPQRQEALRIEEGPVANEDLELLSSDAEELMADPDSGDEVLMPSPLPVTTKRVRSRVVAPVDDSTTNDDVRPLKRARRENIKSTANRRRARQ